MQVYIAQSMMVLKQENSGHFSISLSHNGEEEESPTANRVHKLVIQPRIEEQFSSIMMSPSEQLRRSMMAPLGCVNEFGSAYSFCPPPSNFMIENNEFNYAGKEKSSNFLDIGELITEKSNLITEKAQNIQRKFSKRKSEMGDRTKKHDHKQENLEPIMFGKLDHLSRAGNIEKPRRADSFGNVSNRSSDQDSQGYSSDLRKGSNRVGFLEHQFARRVLKAENERNDAIEKKAILEKQLTEQSTYILRLEQEMIEIQDQVNETSLLLNEKTSGDARVMQLSDTLARMKIEYEHATRKLEDAYKAKVEQVEGKLRDKHRENVNIALELEKGIKELRRIKTEKSLSFMWDIFRDKWIKAAKASDKYVSELVTLLRPICSLMYIIAVLIGFLWILMYCLKIFGISTSMTLDGPRAVF